MSDRTDRLLLGALMLLPLGFVLSIVSIFIGAGAWGAYLQLMGVPPYILGCHLGMKMRKAVQ